MNRVMKAKNDQRKRLDQKAKKERFYMQASHVYYENDLPESATWFFKRDVVSETKMWWEV